MKRIHDSTRIAELFIKAGLIAAIAATLLLPASISANGAEATPPGERHASLPAPRANGIPLPPIPHLDAIPWLALERAQRGPKIDMLFPAPANPDPALALTGLPLWSAGTGNTQRTNG